MSGITCQHVKKSKVATIKSPTSGLASFELINFEKRRFSQHIYVSFKIVPNPSFGLASLYVVRILWKSKTFIKIQCIEQIISKPTDSKKLSRGKIKSVNKSNVIR